MRGPRSAERDLTDPLACREAMEGADVVLHLAANVGGIGFNRRNPAPLARDNLAMGLNVFEACREPGIACRRQYGIDSCVPVIANLYGPEDNFDLEDSHVIAAMVHKFVAAEERGEPEVVLWGSGEPSREFLYVEDAARALILAAELWAAEVLPGPADLRPQRGAHVAAHRGVHMLAAPARRPD